MTTKEHQLTLRLMQFNEVHDAICECCYKRATQVHHKFEQRSWAKKLYKDLIHHPKNLMNVCSACHIENEHPRLIHWSEVEFCEALGIEVRSKVGH